jgi:hypothetical protein
MTQMAAPTFYAQNYATSLKLALQQQGSLLRPFVTEGPSVAGFEKAVVVDRIEAGSAQLVAGTLQDKVYQNPNTERLWVEPVAYDYSQTIDHFDALKMLSDPASKWVMASNWAIGREWDNEINAAFWRSTKSGQNGASTQAFDTTNQQVAVNFDAAGNTGLTVTKLKRARRKFLGNEVDIERNPLFAIVTDDQDENLLNEAQYISLDFGDRPVLEDGKLKKFLGINFIHCQRLTTNGSGYRRVPVFTREAIEFRTAENLYTSVNKVTNKRGEPWEVYAMSTFGAARTDNKLVVEVLCVEV